MTTTAKLTDTALPVSVWRHPDLRPLDRGILLSLASRAWGTADTCRAPVAEIAAELRVSPRSVRYGLRRLEAAGLIASESDPDTHNRTHRVITLIWKASPDASGDYSALPDHVWQAPGLKAIDRGVLLVLAYRGYGRKTSCYPSLKGVADYLDVSQSTIQRSLDRLEALGLVRFAADPDNPDNPTGRQIVMAWKVAGFVPSATPAPLQPVTTPTPATGATPATGDQPPLQRVTTPPLQPVTTERTTLQQTKENERTVGRSASRGGGAEQTGGRPAARPATVKAAWEALGSESTEAERAEAAQMMASALGDARTSVRWCYQPAAGRVASGEIPAALVLKAFSDAKEAAGVERRGALFVARLRDLEAEHVEKTRRAAEERAAMLREAEEAARIRQARQKAWAERPVVIEADLCQLELETLARLIKAPGPLSKRDLPALGDGLRNLHGRRLVEIHEDHTISLTDAGRQAHQLHCRPDPAKQAAILRAIAAEPTSRGAFGLMFNRFQLDDLQARRLVKAGGVGFVNLTDAGRRHLAALDGIASPAPSMACSTPEVMVGAAAML